MANWLHGLGTRPYRYLRQTGSTNDDAAQWLAEGAPDGALVLAEEQLTGRGRYDRVWQAAPGSALLMSLIVRPRESVEALPRFTLMGAVALAETLAGMGLNPGIKWPNDVLLEGGKVSGILAEAAWHGDQLTGIVLGMGINVRQDALPAEDAIRLNAATLESVLGYAPDRGVLLLGLLAQLDHWRANVEAPELLAAWRMYSVTLGRRVVVVQGAERLTGVAEDIDGQGALLLRLESGKLHRLLAGDVTLRAD